MNDIKPIAVITSSAAKSHLDDIKMKHADMVQGMQDQRMRIEALNQQGRQQERENYNADRDFGQKQQEIMMKSYGRTN